MKLVSLKWIKRTARAFLGLAVLLLGLFIVLNEIFPFPVENLSPPPARMVLDREGAPLRYFLPPDDAYRFPVKPGEVSEVFKKTLLCSEDRYFRFHPGVNPVSILRAAWMNLRAGRVVSGGSTITMQLARLADPRKRTLGAKLVEAFRAVQLELLFSKDELFEYYINLTPYGRNIVGVGAAARFYFGKSPEKLSLGDSAILAVLPRSPTRYDPARHPKEAVAARNRLLDSLARDGFFSPKEISLAKRHEPPGRLFPSPMTAPHFCRFVERARPGEERIATSLDSRVQRVVRDKVRLRIDGLRNLGLENAAVVVLDIKTREIRAMLGSAGYFDRARHGMINGALIQRSPGSTLKPFLYAAGFDRGVIVPQSILLDIPTDYSGYVAKNYDDRYRGRVTVEQALVRSLNAPAVRLLARLGLESFYDLITQAGVSLDKPYTHYGLPLILGGCETTLLDLTNAYASLAAGGVHRPVSFVPNQAGPETRILSPEACYFTSRILAKLERRDMPRSWGLTRDVPAVAWKTGTSFGHRDAWAVGFSAHYAVGVWTGNLDGKAELGISGSEHAGPILFDVFRAIEPGGTSLPEPDILNIDQIEVCAESRLPPGDYCPKTVSIEVIPGVTRLPRDKSFRRIFVDSKTGLRLEGECLAKRPHRPMTIKEYPLELTAWRLSQGMGAPRIPPLSPLCRAVPAGPRPRIVSPDPRTPYRLRRSGIKGFQKIVLTAQTPSDASRLYWYLDGVLSAHGPLDERMFLDPKPGSHKLVVMDDLGRSDSIEFIVE